MSRFLYVGGGLALFAAGIFFLPAPGPGSLVLIVGAALIAQEWEVAARGMDWLELRIRALISWARRVWSRSALPLRAIIVLLALALGAALAYGAYRVLFGR